ncbi:CsbD family protein [Actinophytocola sp. KF-1]
MSTFDEAKDKAQDFMGQAKEKFGRQQDDQQNEGSSDRVDELRDKASDAMQNAKDRFGN